jgi:hypothetical protein
MTPKDKSQELVNKYKNILMDEDTDCGNEVLCTLIAKSCALIAVDEIIDIAYWEYMDSGGGQEKEYLLQVKKEIEKI